MPVPCHHVRLLRSQTGRLSAPSMAVSTHGVCLAFLHNPSRAHTKLPWLSLVGLRPPCLDGCLSSFAKAQLSGNSHVHLVSVDVLHLFTSCLGTQHQVEPPAFVVVPVPSFQTLSIQCHQKRPCFNERLKKKNGKNQRRSATAHTSPLSQASCQAKTE